MKKSLAEWDEIYRDTMKDFSKEDRIEYCYTLIDQNQKILTQQGLELPKLKRLMLSELMEAAQKEIQVLTGIKTSRQSDIDSNDFVNKDSKDSNTNSGE